MFYKESANGALFVVFAGNALYLIDIISNIVFKIIR
jgi:hypothetical protein